LRSARRNEERSAGLAPAGNTSNTGDHVALGTLAIVSVPRTELEAGDAVPPDTGDDVSLSASADWGLRALLMVLLVWLGWSQRAGSTSEEGAEEEDCEEGPPGDLSSIDATVVDSRSAPKPVRPPQRRKRDHTTIVRRVATSHVATPTAPTPMAPTTIVVPADLATTHSTATDGTGRTPEPTETSGVESPPCGQRTVTTAGLTPNQQWVATAAAVGAIVAYRAGRRTQQPR